MLLSTRSGGLPLKLKRITSSIYLNKEFFSTGLGTDNDEVITEIKNHKKILTLNRPKALNALNLTMIRTLYKELQNNNASLIIIKGAGGKAFCAGGDVVAVSKSYKEKTNIYKDFFREEYQLNHLIGKLKIPYISILDGITMGGGCGISINGRFKVATENTLLAMPETALGLFPDVGGTYFLSRLKNNLGLFLALTGFRLKGIDVFHSGLASHYIESEGIRKVLEELSNLPIEKCNELNIHNLLLKYQPRKMKNFSLENDIVDIEESFDAFTIEQIFDKIKNGKSEFLKKQLEQLEKMIFPIEYRLSQRFMENHDFHEGCRAILIDKDKSPKWKPSKIEEITDAMVEAYFSPFDNPEDELIL